MLGANPESWTPASGLCVNAVQTSLAVVPMTATSSSLQVFGVPFSQPVRAVVWLLLHQQQAFELVPVNPGSKGPNGSRNPEFLAMNPAGTIPTLRDSESGFALGESHAIMCYLCNRFAWTDLYPTQPEPRARVDWLLHYHQRNLRECSLMVAPSIRKDLAIPDAMQQASRATVMRALDALETGWLAAADWLAGEQLTIADFGAYAEIGQLQPRYTNLLDFAAWPRVSAWLERMADLPGHDIVHTPLAELGDISRDAPDIETIKRANVAGMKALAAAVAAF